MSEENTLKTNLIGKWKDTVTPLGDVSDYTRKAFFTGKRNRNPVELRVRHTITEYSEQLLVIVNEKDQENRYYSYDSSSGNPYENTNMDESCKDIQQLVKDKFGYTINLRKGHDFNHTQEQSDLRDLTFSVNQLVRHDDTGKLCPPNCPNLDKVSLAKDERTYLVKSSKTIKVLSKKMNSAYWHNFEKAGKELEGRFDKKLQEVSDFLNKNRIRERAEEHTRIQALNLKDKDHVQEIKETPQKTLEPTQFVQEEKKSPIYSNGKEVENMQEKSKKDTRTIVTRQDLNTLIQDKLAEKVPSLQEAFQADPDQRFQAVKTFIQENEENRKLYQEARKEVFEKFTLDPSEIRKSPEKDDVRQKISRSDYNQKIWDKLSEKDSTLKSQLDNEPDSIKKFEIVNQFINDNDANKALFADVKEQILKEYTVERHAQTKRNNTNTPEQRKENEFKKIRDKMSSLDENFAAGLKAHAGKEDDFVKSYIKSSLRGRAVYTEAKKAVNRDKMNIIASSRKLFAKEYPDQIKGLDVQTQITKEASRDVRKEIWRKNGEAIHQFLNDPATSKAEQKIRKATWHNCMDRAAWKVENINKKRDEQKQIQQAKKNNMQR